MTGRTLRNLILGIALLASASACREEQVATEEILPSVSAVEIAAPSCVFSSSGSVAMCEFPVPRSLFPAYLTVSRTTSSIVVTPSAIFRRPLPRSVIMPSSIALRRSSRAEAPTRISSRSSSLISITS